MSPLVLLALSDTGLFHVETALQGDGLHYRCPYPLPTNSLFRLFGGVPVGSSVFAKAGRILFQYTNTAVVEVLRSGTSWDSNLLVLLRHLLPVGSLALLCVYCLSRCKKIKCHSWRHFLISISVVLWASFLCISHNNASTSFGLGPAACNLDQKCQFYLISGLAPSTRQGYRPAERQLIDFCTLDDHVSSNGSLLPTNEQTLRHFCSQLAGCLHHSSIKVYLSAIRSLHIDQGFPGPLNWWTASNFSIFSGALSTIKAQLSHNARFSPVSTSLRVSSLRCAGGRVPQRACSQAAWVHLNLQIY